MKILLLLLAPAVIALIWMSILVFAFSTLLTIFLVKNSRDRNPDYKVCGKCKKTAKGIRVKSDDLMERKFACPSCSNLIRTETGTDY